MISIDKRNGGLMVRSFAKNLSNKKVMGIDGSNIGTMHNVVVDLHTGALIDLVIKPDMAFDTEGFRTEDNFMLVSFEAVRAMKDYIVVDLKMRETKVGGDE
ncbi:MAG: PRC-barrel domain-containing protein [Methanocellales archaeon]|nr:PRC-barrel domain-containing protein [Methanocellales archaeon]MDD5447313.1 PRC-barrel domain-containing protein [Methanocellales archaeon]